MGEKNGMRVRLLRSVFIEGEPRDRGEVLALPRDVALALVGSGAAAIITDAKKPVQRARRADAKKRETRQK